MAVSKPTGCERCALAYMCESRVAFGDILFLFRQCHDVCEQSGLFQKNTIMKIDQCGVDFRQLSLDTATIARKVSSMWLDLALVLFKNIDDVEDPREMLQLLGSQAGELAMCFRTISGWAREISGRIHDAIGSSVREAEVFKREYSIAQERAEGIEKEMQTNLSKAQKRYEKALGEKKLWNFALLMSCRNPVAIIVTSIGSIIAWKKTITARELERKADEELATAATQMAECKDENAKAQMVGNSVVKLMGVLTNMASMNDAMATFWTIQADNFCAQAGKMKVSQPLMIRTMKSMVGDDNIAVWTTAKDELERYAVVMSMISNCFNYTTEAKPSPREPLSLPNLDLTLHVPSGVIVRVLPAS